MIVNQTPTEYDDVSDIKRFNDLLDNMCAKYFATPLIFISSVDNFSNASEIASIDP